MRRALPKTPPSRFGNIYWNQSSILPGPKNTHHQIGESVKPRSSRNRSLNTTFGNRGWSIDR